MLIEQIIELKEPLNACEMLSNGIKTAFFSKKLRKIARRLGPSPPDHRL